MYVIYAHSTPSMQKEIVDTLNNYGVESGVKFGKTLEDSGVEPLTSCMPCKRSTN